MVVGHSKVYVIVYRCEGETDPPELVFEDKEHAEKYADHDMFSRVYEARLIKKGEPVFPEVD